MLAGMPVFAENSQMRYVGDGRIQASISCSTGSFNVRADATSGIKSISVSGVLYEKGLFGYNQVSSCSKTSNSMACTAAGTYSFKSGKTYKLEYSATFSYTNGTSETITHTGQDGERIGEPAVAYGGPKSGFSVLIPVSWTQRFDEHADPDEEIPYNGRSWAVRKFDNETADSQAYREYTGDVYAVMSVEIVDQTNSEQCHGLLENSTLIEGTDDIRLYCPRDPEDNSISYERILVRAVPDDDLGENMSWLVSIDFDGKEGNPTPAGDLLPGIRAQAIGILQSFALAK